MKHIIQSTILSVSAFLPFQFLSAQPGSNDPTFNIGSGFGGTRVNAVSVQDDSKVLVIGSFSSFNTVPHSPIVRLNADGTLDSGFQSGSGPNAVTTAMTTLTDGRIIVAGAFTSFNGAPRGRIARLFANGELDPSFNPGNGLSAFPNVIAHQADEMVLVGGYFESFDGTPLTSGFARLNANGTLDTSFDPVNGSFDGGVYALAVQPDGRILVGGTNFNTSHAGLVRLHPDGSLDAGFNAGGLGLQRFGEGSVYVQSITMQPDGRIILGGLFTSYNGVPRHNIVRLNPDGQLDPTFDPGSGLDNQIRDIKRMPDGRLIVAGWFTTVDGVPRAGLARLAADGSLDMSFNPGSGVNAVYPSMDGINSIGVQQDGRIIVAGQFTAYNGAGRNHIARVFNDCLAGTPCDDGNASTVNDVLDAGCLCAGVPIDPCLSNILEIEFQSDGISQVQWTVHDQLTGAPVQGDGGVLEENPAAGWSFCLPNGCYYLVVTDDAGDGFVDGGYILRTVEPAIARIIDNTRNFTTGYTSQIAGGDGFCLPLGEVRLIASSCDKLDWRTAPCHAEYVVANDYLPVTLQEGVTDATSGYQIWWYDPNGGYSFKRFQSFLTPNGLNPGPVRPCHFRPNSWSGNQLQEGVLYNVKVRPRVAGAYGHWGPACRFTIDNVGAQCPRTRLMDIPDNRYLSCGQSRAIGSNQLVHARPVKRMLASCTYQNANRYQFRFRLPAEAITVVKTGASNQYWVNTVDLACGKTYEVDVRASFDNGATWCHDGETYGELCLLTTTCGFNGMAQEGSSNGAVAAQLSLYPNPNRGEELYLSLSRVAENVESVSVEVYDNFGKRVAARNIATTDGFVNSNLQLTDLANGLYMVSITAGEQQFVERLLIQQ